MLFLYSSNTLNDVIFVITDIDTMHKDISRLQDENRELHNRLDIMAFQDKAPTGLDVFI